jgi:hypothetical protein
MSLLRDDPLLRVVPLAMILEIVLAPLLLRLLS